MLVLHASWVLDQRLNDGALVFWGEIEKSGRSGRGPGDGTNRDPRGQAHPFAATGPQLASVLKAAGIEAPSLARARRAFVNLPTVNGRPLSSAEKPAENAADVSALPWSVPVVGYAQAEALEVLGVLSARDREPSPQPSPRGRGGSHGGIGDDVRFWGTARLFGLELLARQHVMPGVEMYSGA